MKFMHVQGKKINLNTCPDCKGSGHTEATRPIMQEHADAPKLRTVALGSGCPRCKGLGELVEAATHHHLRGNFVITPTPEKRATA